MNTVISSSLKISMPCIAMARAIPDWQVSKHVLNFSMPLLFNLSLPVHSGYHHILPIESFSWKRFWIATAVSTYLSTQFTMQLSVLPSNLADIEPTHMSQHISLFWNISCCILPFWRSIWNWINNSSSRFSTNKNLFLLIAQTLQIHLNRLFKKIINKTS